MAMRLFVKIVYQHRASILELLCVHYLLGYTLYHY